MLYNHFNKSSFWDRQFNGSLDGTQCNQGFLMHLINCSNLDSAALHQGYVLRQKDSREWAWSGNPNPATSVTCNEAPGCQSHNIQELALCRSVPKVYVCSGSQTCYTDAQCNTSLGAGPLCHWKNTRFLLVAQPAPYGACAQTMDNSKSRVDHILHTLASFSSTYPQAQ